MRPVYHRRTVIEDEDSAAQDVVVCTKCGAHMKATRERCLRCFEPLHVDRSQLPIWRSLHISDRVGMQVAAVAGVAVLALVWVLWTTNRRDPSIAEPATAQNGAAPAPGAATPSSPPASGTASESAGAAAPMATEPPDSADDLASTRHAFEEKLKTDPNDPVALNGLGLVLQREGDQQGALAAFRHAAEVAPRNATIRANIARLEGQLGQWSRAVADYRVAARLTPDDYAAQLNLGLALQQMHDDAAAVQELETAIQMAPREAAAHRALGISLERVGRAPDAVREYRRYLELAPDAPDADSIRERAQRLNAGS